MFHSSQHISFHTIIRQNELLVSIQNFIYRQTADKSFKNFSYKYIISCVATSVQTIMLQSTAAFAYSCDSHNVCIYVSYSRILDKQKMVPPV
jgi:hypothetical protein